VFIFTTSISKKVIYKYQISKINYFTGNFTFERKKQLEQFEKKIIEQLDALKSAILPASNIYWRCDPAKHVKDTTYLEVTQLLQV